MKKFTALLLTAAMVVTMFVVAPLAVSAADAIGAKDAGKASGTPEGTAITALSQITDPAGKYYLSADITSAGAATIAEFKGTLDGNGHKIAGLTAPLFNELNGATIKNISIESAYTVSDSTSIASRDPDGNAMPASGAIANIVENGATFNNVKLTVAMTVPDTYTSYFSAAGFVASAVSGDLSFTNCEINGSIENKAKTGYVSGLFLAFNFATSKCADPITFPSGTTISANQTYGGNVTITNCTNNATMTGTNKTAGFSADTRNAQIVMNNCLSAGALNTSSNSGGLLGYLGGSGSAEIENCKNTAKLTAMGGALGGIVGKADCTISIKDCINEGDLIYAEGSTAATGDNATGGILGAHRSKGATIIDNCQNKGKIDKNGANAGGIIGDAKGGTDLTITNCKNTGNVTTNQSRPAGIVACVDGTFTGNVTIKNCTNSGVITCSDATKDCAAGILGYLNAALAGSGETPTAVEIANCTNNGAVDGGKDKAGGIIGYVNLTGTTNATMTIKDCNNKATVTSKDSNCIAGICGQFKANVDGKLTTTMTNCDNSGAVTQVAATAEARTAGIIGNLEYGSGKTLEGKMTIDGCDNKADVSAAGTGNVSGIVARTVAIATAPVEIKNCYNSGKLTDTNVEDLTEAAYYGVAPEAENLTITSSACKHQALCTAPTECILCHATEGVTEPTLVHNYDETGKCACGAEKPAEEPDEPLGDATIWVLAISMIALLGTAITVSVKRRA